MSNAALPEREAAFARRRRSFDDIPDLYARARPGYPEAVFDAVFAYAALRAGDTALEIGCGPGHATLPMARRGLRITAIELGERMADYARQAVAGLDVRVICSPFEEWPLPDERFPLVYAASSFHWLDSGVRCSRAAEALRPGGTLALFWNRQTRETDPDPFFDALQAVYASEAPELAARYDAASRGDQMRMEYADEIARSGLFGPVTVKEFASSISFTSETYAALLSTYSDHATLEDSQRDRLLRSVGELIESRFGGRISRPWTTILFLAKRLA